MNQWIKACGTNNCIEVMFIEYGALIRNTAEPEENVTSVTTAEWDEFVAAVKAGQFDRPAS